MDQLVIAARQLPGPVDASTAADIEGHTFEIIRTGLVVVQRAGRRHGIAIGGMLRDVVDQLSVQIDGSTVEQALNMLRAVLYGRFLHRTWTRHRVDPPLPAGYFPRSPTNDR